MARRAYYGGQKSRRDGNERGFNDDYNRSEKRVGKHNDWLTTNSQFLLPRFAYPGQRTPVSQGPFFPRRAANVGVVASRYPIYTTGGFRNAGGAGRQGREESFSPKDDERKKTKRMSSRFILCITFVIFFVLIAIAMAIVAIYLALREDNKEIYSGTYEAKVRMANEEFNDKLGDVTSGEFSREQEDFCSRTKTSVDGAVKNCVVDAFSNGSLVIQSSLEFDLDKLEMFVKKGGSVPSEETIITTIERVLAVDKQVTINFVRKEPEFLSFRLRTWMQTNATEDDYCKAITDVYGNAIVGLCSVTARGADHVDCTIRLNTKAMKTLARNGKRRSDIVGIRTVVKGKLVDNKIEFFMSQTFLKDRSEVHDFSKTGDVTSGGGDATETTPKANTATTKQAPANTASTASTATDTPTTTSDSTASTASTATDTPTTTPDSTASTALTATDTPTTTSDSTASTTALDTNITTESTMALGPS